MNQYLKLHRQMQKQAREDWPDELKAAHHAVTWQLYGMAHAKGADFDAMKPRLAELLAALEEAKRLR